MRVAVVLSTYNQPDLLEKVLWGYAAQTHREFEVVIADDGSAASTAEVVNRMRREACLEILHLWHEDRGFRKCAILNRAIVSTACEYLIFSDGDCVPRNDFVAVHVGNAAPGCFLSGGYLRLPAAVSERVTREEILCGIAFRADWLRSQGWRPGRRSLRLQRGFLAALLDRVTPTRATWNGHNASTWREALLRVNGFDVEMGYGGEDRALGERLRNLGYTGVQIRHRAPCLHLHHERPYLDRAVVRANGRFRAAIRRERRVEATRGIIDVNSGPV